MKASNDGLFDWNLETNNIYYSPGWKRILGYQDNELPNDFSVWEKATDPEDVKKSWEQQQKLISGQIDRFVMEFKMKHKAGHLVNILSRAEAFFNENGKAIRIVGTHTDITERKQTEAKIKIQSEILSNMTEAVYLIRKSDGLIVYTNEAFEKMFGYLNGEMIGKPVTIVNASTQKSPEKTAKEIFSVIAKTGTWKGEVYNIKKNGVKFWSAAQVSLYNHPEFGDVLISAHRDITQRVQSEKELHVSEQIFRNFMEHSPIYVFFKDKNMRAIRLSKNYETMLNKPLEELLGKNMDELFPSDLAKSMVADDIKTLNENKEITVEEEFNGRYYSTIKFPIHIEGKPTYLAGYTVDIAEQKKAEIELKENEAKLRGLFENLNAGILVHAPDTSIIMSNAFASKILGLSNKQMRG